jgi:hypothetical protein
MVIDTSITGLIGLLGGSTKMILMAKDTLQKMIERLQGHANHRNFLWAVLLAIFARSVVFAGAIIWPIPNEGLLPVSPLHPPAYQDISFYLSSLKHYVSASPVELFSQFIEFYQRPLEKQFGHIIAGPVFPGLVALFNIRDGSPLPFAVFFLIVGSVTAIMWLWIMAISGVSRWWIFLFSIAPNPIWFMLILSPDALFAFMICLFYVSYFRDPWRKFDVILWCCAAILALLTRPNGFSLLTFVFVDMIARHFLYKRHNYLTLFGIVILIILFSLYLYPYFITELRKSLVDTQYFGIRSSEYIAGMIGILPTWLDLLVSWGALAGAKVLYFVGLRPSYGETTMTLVFVRAAAGLVLLPGLIHIIFAMPRRQKLFVALFCLPIFLGPAQDRYNLPIFPLLFLHGALAYQALYKQLRGSWYVVSASYPYINIIRK